MSSTLLHDDSSKSSTIPFVTDHGAEVHHEERNHEVKCWHPSPVSGPGRGFVWPRKEAMNGFGLLHTHLFSSEDEGDHGIHRADLPPRNLDEDVKWRSPAPARRDAYAGKVRASPSPKRTVRSAPATIVTSPSMSVRSPSRTGSSPSWDVKKRLVEHIGRVIEQAAEVSEGTLWVWWACADTDADTHVRKHTRMNARMHGTRTDACAVPRACAGWGGLRFVGALGLRTGPACRRLRCSARGPLPIALTLP